MVPIRVQDYAVLPYVRQRAPFYSIITQTSRDTEGSHSCGTPDHASSSVVVAVSWSWYFDAH